MLVNVRTIIIITYSPARAMIPLVIIKPKNPCPVGIESIRDWGGEVHIISLFYNKNFAAHSLLYSITNLHL